MVVEVSPNSSEIDVAKSISLAARFEESELS
jgi:hypothetical protein